MRTDVPSLVWHAPFFSGGGYCSEATAFVVALDDMRLDVAIEMHGDSHNNDYINGLNPTTLGRLYTLSGAPPREGTRTSRSATEPGAAARPTPSWPSSPCPRPCTRNGGPYYVVGRTMFETGRSPDGWADRLNKVDEVWVPTDFHKDIFEDAGVLNVQVVASPLK